MSLKSWKSKLLFLFVVSTVTTLPLQVPSFFAAPQDEISSVVGDFKQAWESLDLKRLENLFDLDYPIEYYPAEMMRVQGGREGLPAYFKDATKHLSEVKLTIKDTKTDSFGDIAYAAFLWGFQYKWDGTPGSSEGRSTLILRKKEGKWKIIHYHESVPTY